MTVTLLVQTGEMAEVKPDCHIFRQARLRLQSSERVCHPQTVILRLFWPLTQSSRSFP